jgi:predicted nucleotidyltransferase
MDTQVTQAAHDFLRRIERKYPITEAFLFGSRARSEASKNSDTDVAILLDGAAQSRADVVIDMAGIAFDVLVDTGILIDALPLWQNEWQHPEQCSNPALLENIRQQGVRL